MKGIDVSYHNGDVDWQSVVDAGCQFAIIRLGYGNRHLDPKFADHVNGALAVGLKIGVYYYSYALDIEAAKGEAQFVQETLQEYGVNPELGIWFDMEDADGYKERNGMPDNQTITDMCSAFVCSLNKADYSYVGIYASYSWLTEIIDTSQLEEYVPYWNAQWGGSNDFPHARMWQYTDCLCINGRNFDGNEYYEQVFQEWGGAQCISPINLYIKEERIVEVPNQTGQPNVKLEENGELRLTSTTTAKEMANAQVRLIANQELAEQKTVYDAQMKKEKDARNRELLLWIVGTASAAYL